MGAVSLESCQSGTAHSLLPLKANDHSPMAHKITSVAPISQIQSIYYASHMVKCALAFGKGTKITTMSTAHKEIIQRIGNFVIGAIISD